jgi:hypothetical protein
MSKYAFSPFSIAVFDSCLETQDDDDEEDDDEEENTRLNRVKKASIVLHVYYC